MARTYGLFGNKWADNQNGVLQAPYARELAKPGTIYVTTKPAKDIAEAALQYGRFVLSPDINTYFNTLSSAIYSVEQGVKYNNNNAPNSVRFGCTGLTPEIYIYSASGGQTKVSALDSNEYIDINENVERAYIRDCYIPNFIYCSPTNIDDWFRRFNTVYNPNYKGEGEFIKYINNEAFNVYKDIGLCKLTKDVATPAQVSQLVTQYIDQNFSKLSESQTVASNKVKVTNTSTFVNIAYAKNTYSKAAIQLDASLLNSQLQIIKCLCPLSQKIEFFLFNDSVQPGTNQASTKVEVYLNGSLQSSTNFGYAFGYGGDGYPLFTITSQGINDNALGANMNIFVSTSGTKKRIDIFVNAAYGVPVVKYVPQPKPQPIPEPIKNTYVDYSDFTAYACLCVDNYTTSPLKLARMTESGVTIIDSLTNKWGMACVGTYDFSYLMGGISQTDYYEKITAVNSSAFSPSLIMKTGVAGHTEGEDYKYGNYGHTVRTNPGEIKATLKFENLNLNLSKKINKFVFSTQVITVTASSTEVLKIQQTVSSETNGYFYQGADVFIDSGFADDKPAIIDRWSNLVWNSRWNYNVVIPPKQLEYFICIPYKRGTEFLNRLTLYPMDAFDVNNKPTKYNKTNKVFNFSKISLTSGTVSVIATSQVIQNVLGYSPPEVAAGFEKTFPYFGISNPSCGAGQNKTHGVFWSPVLKAGMAQGSSLKLTFSTDTFVATGANNLDSIVNGCVGLNNYKDNLVFFMCSQFITVEPLNSVNTGTLVKYDMSTDAKTKTAMKFNGNVISSASCPSYALVTLKNNSEPFLARSENSFPFACGLSVAGETFLDTQSLPPDTDTGFMQTLTEKQYRAREYIVSANQDWQWVQIYIAPSTTWGRTKSFACALQKPIKNPNVIFTKQQDEINFTQLFGLYGSSQQVLTSGADTTDSKNFNLAFSAYSRSNEDRTLLNIRFDSVVKVDFTTQFVSTGGSSISAVSKSIGFNNYIAGSFAAVPGNFTAYK